MKMHHFLAVLFLAGAVHASPIAEPSTIFYGKVTGVGGEQPFPVQEGELAWTIEKADGSTVEFFTELYPLHGGEFSYRLNVPHSAIAYELDGSGHGIPLPPVSETNYHASATVDGLAVKFVGPSGEAFSAGQMTRAETYRLDMTLNLVPDDSDGDGIPDWWEDENGLDKQDLADAAIDSDGDGVSNADEYLAGTNPFFDNRTPSLLDVELLAFEQCMTGVRIDAVDSDTSAAEVLFTLTKVPMVGNLILRNAQEDPENPNLVLSQGSTFSQQAVNEGRLVFVHADTDAVEKDAFEVSISDGVHVPTLGTIAISFYEVPENLGLMSTAEQQRHRAFLAAQGASAVLWDAVRSLTDVAFAAPSSALTSDEYFENYVPSFGIELSQIMTGGHGDDELLGGMADDVIVGGAGEDALAGSGGADTFAYDLGDDASDTIADFNSLEGDQLDFSKLLAKRGGMVHDSIQFQINGADTRVGLNVEPGDTAFTNQVLTLTGVNLDEAAGYQLVLNGSVRVGGLRLQPCISIAATDDSASENGNNSGVFTLTRQGDLSGPVDVAFSVAGSAQNGVDYSTVASSVRFEAGRATATVKVSPFADSQAEPEEVVELTLQDGDGYCLSELTQATLLIKDLQAVVGVEVLEAKGVVGPMIPAVLVVTRSGPVANGLSVRLKIGGSAQNGVDYQYLPPSLNFAPGVTEMPLLILPSVGASLSGGAESVTVSVLENAAYALADIYEGRVTLIDQMDTLAGWKDRVAPEATESLTDFARQSTSDGLDNLRRYAYGLNAEEPELDRLPKVVFRNGRMHVDFCKNLSATDVRFVVEASDDLQTWTASESVIQKVVVPELKDQVGMETYEVVEPVTVLKKCYVRVRVIYDD